MSEAMPDAAITPYKPFYLKCCYDWFVANKWSPVLVYLAAYPGCSGDLVSDSSGRNSVNIAPSAIQDLVLDVPHGGISFTVEQDGQPIHVQVPFGAVIALYAHENGNGPVWEVDIPAAPADAEGRPVGKPHLSVVRSS